MYGKGISRINELIDYAVELDIIQKSGAWFNYGDVRLAQGRDNTKAMLLENDELRNEIEKKVVEGIVNYVPEKKTKKGAKRGKDAEPDTAEDSGIEVDIGADQ